MHSRASVSMQRAQREGAATARAQAGKVTRTELTSAEVARDDGPARAAATRPRRDVASRATSDAAAASRAAQGDPYLDPASLGLAMPAPSQDDGQGASTSRLQLQRAAGSRGQSPTRAGGGGGAPAAQAGGGAQPVPLDVFLRVERQVRLARAGADGTLAPTTVVLEEGALVRAAQPAEGTLEVAGQRYVCDSAERFGFVPADAVTQLDATSEAVAGAEGIDEEVPDDAALPELGPDDYANLTVIDRECQLYRLPSASSTSLGTVAQMESVVYLGDAESADGHQWQHVRTLRQPPVTGYLLDPVGSAATTSVSADDDAAAPTFAASGTWVSGYVLVDSTPGVATTVDGAASAAGYASGAQGPGSTMSGACQVLHEAGAPAVYASAEGDRWYVRGEAGGAGWVLARSVRPADAGATSEVADVGVAEELAELCPNGISVAFVTQFTDREGRSFSTFLAEGSAFAAGHHAVALSGGHVVTGTVNLITHKHEIVGILAGIQQALRGGAAELPAWARVAHLAFFTHGAQSSGARWGGLQTDGDDWGDDGNLHAEDLTGFARSLTAFCTSDVEVSLYACSTGMEDAGEHPEVTDYQGWLQQPSLTGGEGSFADSLADELVAAGAGDAQVMGHSTVGHTVRNSAARLFTGGDQGGVNIFNWVFLPLSGWLGTELADIGRTGEVSDADAFLQGELFAWLRDEVLLVSSRMATLMSDDPELFKVQVRENARAWVHAQYERWGAMTEAQYATRRAILSPRSGSRQPSYRWPGPAQVVTIEAGTEITVLGPAESLGGVDSYPVTWAGDPYPPGSANAVQAYLPVNWIEYVYDE